MTITKRGPSFQPSCPFDSSREWCRAWALGAEGENNCEDDIRALQNVAQLAWFEWNAGQFGNNGNVCVASRIHATQHSSRLLGEKGHRAWELWGTKGLAKRCPTSNGQR